MTQEEFDKEHKNAAKLPDPSDTILIALLLAAAMLALRLGVGWLYILLCIGLGLMVPYMQHAAWRRGEVYGFFKGRIVGAREQADEFNEGCKAIIKEMEERARNDTNDRGSDPPTGGTLGGAEGSA